jgi:hypothetical protein
VQRFNIVPQVNPAFSGSGLAGPFPEQATSMYLLRRSLRSNGSPLGDIIPLSQLRALVDLCPHFSEKADNRLTIHNGMAFSKEFWLNKYFDKEMFFAFVGLTWYAHSLLSSIMTIIPNRNV